MAQKSRIEVALLMKKIGFIPLFYHHDIMICKKILQACYHGGARLLEFTARGDFSLKIFEELNKYTLNKLPEMVLGVGSVTDSATASMYMEVGANFIVTPTLREDIAIVCNRRKVLWSPGCGSLTEINRAEELGCEVVKLFPGDIYGPSFVKSILGPQPWTSVMPTGGVTTEVDNLKGWFEAGVTCVGIGSKLINNDIIFNQDYKGLENTVKKTLETIALIRK